MSPKKNKAGGYKGFLDNSTCLETNCFRTQTRNRTAAPASKAKVDHSSTAPKANTAKIKRPPRPRTSPQRRIRGSRPRWRPKSIESVVSTTAYDDIFTFTDP